MPEYHAPVAPQTPVTTEAADATRGSAIKLVAELASRLLLAATTLLLARVLGASDWGVFTAVQAIALLLAEVGEFGLQVLASRVLVVGTFTLRALARARLVLTLLVSALALLALPLGPRLLGMQGVCPTLSLLMAWFALSGWGEFLGVALRCRGARLYEALLLVLLRGGALGSVLGALALGGGLAGVAFGLALSPVPAILFGALVLRSSRTRSDASCRSAGVWAVLRASLPLAIFAGLLLLSPRVELLVLTPIGDEREIGLLGAGLLVFWFLAFVPSAVSAGAMPALSRESLRGDGAVRRRTAATLTLLAAPASVGLWLLAGPAAALALGARWGPGDQDAVAALLRLLAPGVPALFLNALVAAVLNAAGRASWLPRLILGRVVIAFGLAVVLVPAFGARGAVVGLVTAEWLLLASGSYVCRRASLAIPVARPLAGALLACAPMALVVSGLVGNLALAVGVGGLTWLATLAAAYSLAPSLAKGLLGRV
jgi:O-antigen/teichoic acid export membrane protein